MLKVHISLMAQKNRNKEVRKEVKNVFDKGYKIRTRLSYYGVTAKLVALLKSIIMRIIIVMRI